MQKLVTCLAIRLFALIFAALLMRSQGQTFATLETTVGTIELELFDADKPVTVSNFVKYVTSGRWETQFIQRWEPNFVIQAGGYSVTNLPTGPVVQPVPIFGNITNEYSVGRIFSNTYGTIAMARQPGNTNSASSQWFINLTNNAFLDNVDGGFTVFGKVTRGTNILNLFIPTPPTNGIATNGIYKVNAGGALTTLPALHRDPTFEDLIYVKVKLRRDLNLAVNPTRPGQRRISWTTVAGVSNILEYADVGSTNWTVITNIAGTGFPYSIIDASTGKGRIFRTRLIY